MNQPTQRESGAGSTDRPFEVPTLEPAQQVQRGQMHPQAVARFPGRVRKSGAERVAKGLALFSLALGAAQLAIPRQVGELIGLKRPPTRLLRFMGLREVLHGVLILSQRKPALAVWSRVAGDALDLAGLALAFGQPRADRNRLAAATAALAGVTVIDSLTARRLAQETGLLTEDGTLRASAAVTINRKPEDVYRFWRSYENLPRFMFNLLRVTDRGDGLSHWVSRGPAGKTVAWEAETTADRPDELIAWRTVGQAQVEHAGTVRFEPGPAGRGTVVRVEMEYWPPGGLLGAGVAKLLGEAPEQKIKNDLRRLKNVMETGEIVRSEGSLLGPGTPGQRPARPPVRKFIR